MRYIEPNKNKIKRGGFKDISLSSFSGWNSIIALQFENLVLNNREKLKTLLNIQNEDIVYDNPYFQTAKKGIEACQVDYMIQSCTKNLYICEIKFSKNKINSTIIAEMQQKIERLKLSKGYSFRPVLIHVNGVEKSVVDSDFL